MVVPKISEPAGGRSPEGKYRLSGKQVPRFEIEPTYGLTRVDMSSLLALLQTRPIASENCSAQINSTGHGLPAPRSFPVLHTIIPSIWRDHVPEKGSLLR